MVAAVKVPELMSVGAQLLRRGPDGTWPELPLTIEAGDLVLESIGFQAPIAALYAGTWLAPA